MDRYEIIGALDTETSNIDGILGVRAYPILYQLGLMSARIEQITPENAKHLIDVKTYRYCEDLYKELDNIISKRGATIPVILVHNLGFDMYALAPYFLRHKVRVLAKTAKKPISIQIVSEEDKPLLIFLDTLGLFMKSLATMGEECGMPKAIGDWDYLKVRSPDTPLTAEELGYAEQDIKALLCYMGYFLRKNPDIKPNDIGVRVQTKTGIVRAKRMVHVGNLKSNRLKYKVRQYWHLQNKSEVPKSDDELFTMQASTRGGFTFVAKNNASRVFIADSNIAISSYDSTSQHPAQMCSHLYPSSFKETDSERMLIAFETAASVSLDRVLKKWLKPFPFAFYGAFTFENLRPKENSLFAEMGIYPLASARLSSSAPLFDNEAASAFKDWIADKGYRDSAQDPVCNYGKLESASTSRLYLTELEAWIISRCYDYDSVFADDGYMSTSFRKASDMSLLSVMRFYKAKNALKSFMSVYKACELNNVESIKGLFPDVFVNKCAQGEAYKSELKQEYMLAKADLNSLFGIEATNEARRDFELGENGFKLVGSEGLHNMPKSPKCFYQYGQRIVGWSRVAQVCIMELIAPYVDQIICGDTDSLKFSYKRSNESDIKKALQVHAKALDRAKLAATKRVRYSYREHYDSLEGIGHYVFDGSYEALSASWNKSYIGLVDGKCKITIAGIPASKRANGFGTYEDFCNDLLKEGWSFERVASLAIGYNVTLDSNITKLNVRYHPANFGGFFKGEVCDYLGKKSYVEAPEAIALFPGVKTIGDTSTKENLVNSKIAMKNNPNVNTKPVWLRWEDGKPKIVY